MTWGLCISSILDGFTSIGSSLIGFNKFHSLFQYKNNAGLCRSEGISISSPDELGHVLLISWSLVRAQSLAPQISIGPGLKDAWFPAGSRNYF
jgi:hypothetical protein